MIRVHVHIYFEDRLKKKKHVLVLRIAEFVIIYVYQDLLWSKNFHLKMKFPLMFIFCWFGFGISLNLSSTFAKCDNDLFQLF